MSETLIELVRWDPSMEYKVSLFYRYCKISDDEVDVMVEQYRSFFDNAGILGRLLISTEGINGTLAGSISAVDLFVAELTKDERFTNIDWKFSIGKEARLPFLGISVRRVKELISPGTAISKFIGSHIEFDEKSFGGLIGTGKHLTPEEFHDGTIR